MESQTHKYSLLYILSLFLALIFTFIFLIYVAVATEEYIALLPLPLLFYLTYQVLTIATTTITVDEQGIMKKNIFTATQILWSENPTLNLGEEFVPDMYSGVQHFTRVFEVVSGDRVIKFYPNIQNVDNLCWQIKKHTNYKKIMAQ